jgi:hypothetical protein
MNSLINSLPINIDAPSTLIHHQDKVLLIGSCFSEHMGKRLADAKFRVLENPHGILFNPLSVCHSLNTYIQAKLPAASDLFHLNEVWNSWDFHSRFSHIDKDEALSHMQSSICHAHSFLKDADWLMITLGSSFQYFLAAEDTAVANCHRAPGQWFEKRLLSIKSIQEALRQTIHNLKVFNPKLKIIFTISPVRHIRDGVVDNNRSKARLIEVIHELVSNQENCFYFPAYELLIDVLRDYRYYDIDMVHPNFAATQVVWEQFVSHFLAPEAQKIAALMQALTTARNHKVRFEATNAFHKFSHNFLDKIKQYEIDYPYLDFSVEKDYFSQNNGKGSSAQV